MASSSAAFEKIRMLGQLKSDDQVHAFIREVRKHANRDLKHKLIATVMAQQGAQCHDTQWIAKMALDSLSPKVMPLVPPKPRPQVDVRHVPDKKKITIEYEICPVCINRVEKGTLTTHFLSALTHRDQAVSKIRLLGTDSGLNLLHCLQKSYRLARQLSISLTCPPVPPTMQQMFQSIETKTLQWQRCFEGVPYPSELEELRQKVMEVRFAINLSWIRFEVVRSKDAKPETKVSKAKTETKAPKERERKSSSVWTIQSGHPGSGRRS